MLRGRAYPGLGTEPLLGSHLSPGPQLGSKQQKEEKRDSNKDEAHVKGVCPVGSSNHPRGSSYFTGRSLNYWLPPSNAGLQATCAISFNSDQQVSEHAGSRKQTPMAAVTWLGYSDSLSLLGGCQSQAGSNTGTKQTADYSHHQPVAASPAQVILSACFPGQQAERLPQRIALLITEEEG